MVKLKQYVTLYGLSYPLNRALFILFSLHLSLTLCLKSIPVTVQPLFVCVMCMCVCFEAVIYSNSSLCVSQQRDSNVTLMRPVRLCVSLWPLVVPEAPVIIQEKLLTLLFFTLSLHSQLQSAGKCRGFPAEL